MTIHQNARSIAGQLVKQWRNTRRLSQLDLALVANVSARHISFIETGRSVPSRDMIYCLSEALDVPLRDRNAILTAAGYAAIYTELDLDSDDLRSVRCAVKFILRKHEPNGAFAVDRCWNILLTNDVMPIITSYFVEPDSLPDSVMGNMVKLLYHPQGLRKYIDNWPEIGPMLYRRILREQTHYAHDDKLSSLIDTLKTYAPEITSQDDALPLSSCPTTKITLKKNQWHLDLFSVISTLGTAQDITLQELRIETFFPGNKRSSDQILAMIAEWKKNQPPGRTLCA